jgi:hypothetical protein
VQEAAPASPERDCERVAMTIQQAAEAHFDQQTNRAWRSWPEHQRLDAVQDFIAGAEWALEQAAQKAESTKCGNGCKHTPAHFAAAIRSLSTTTTKEEK